MKTQSLLDALDSDEVQLQSIALESENLEVFIQEHLRTTRGYAQSHEPIRFWAIGLESADDGVEAKKGLATKVLEFIRKLVGKIASYLKNLILAIFGKTVPKTEVEALQKEVAQLAKTKDGLLDTLNRATDQNSQLRAQLRSMIVTSEKAASSIRELETELTAMKRKSGNQEAAIKLSHETITKLMAQAGGLKDEQIEAGLKNIEDQAKLKQALERYRNQFQQLEAGVIDGISAQLKKRSNEVEDKIIRLVLDRQDAFKDALYLAEDRNPLADVLQQATHTVEMTVERLKKYVLNSDTEATPRQAFEPSDYQKENILLVMKKVKDTYQGFKLDERAAHAMYAGHGSGWQLRHLDSHLDNIEAELEKFKKLQKEFDDVEKTCDSIAADLKKEQDPAKVAHLSKVVSEVRGALTTVIAPNMASIGYCATMYGRARLQHTGFLEFVARAWRKACEDMVTEAITSTFETTGIKASAAASAKIADAFFVDLPKPRMVPARQLR